MLGDPRSHGLWERTADPAPETRLLAGEILADVVMVGKDLTGCSAALHLVEGGARVARLAETVITFSGYNGRGIAPGTVFGRALARHILGEMPEEALPPPVTRPAPQTFRAVREAWYEVGKIVSEGLGEVQEMIDICDFAVGLSRQLYGLTIATERGEHRMMETWHPLGVVGIISAFNFPSADLDLTLRGVAFAAMGTAGQRCSTLRRLFVHDSVYDTLVPRLKAAYASVAVGNPLTEGTLVGPLIDKAAFAGMGRALDAAKAAGGTVTGGERADVTGAEGAFYVRPAPVEMPDQIGPVVEETFAPILYVLSYTDFDEALRLQNGVPQGLSSSVFTNDLREAETFLSARGSDCGIANVNIGPSGAEIGGEKETGGGRESGSDAWRAYMRRATNTINYGRTLPLAQGVKFEVG